jgi:magnesium transporter
MLRVWRRSATSYEVVEPAALTVDDTVVWLELFNPTRDEELAVEKALGLGVPTREDMAEIEASSRLYRQDGAVYMTGLVICRQHPDPANAAPRAEPVTFVLAGQRLVTVRYADPKSFALFEAQVAHEPDLCVSGPRVFLGLMEAIVDRLADILEEAGADVKATARQIFRKTATRRFEPIMQRLGAHQHLNVLIHESLVSVSRIVSFARLAPQFEGDAAAQEQLRSQARDVTSLLEHSGYIGATISFQLDAALGLINIEQNDINKVFSIAALMFLPPTLIAGIYGMNFLVLPELHWAFGYPFALGLMLLSVALALVWVKRKGWL